MFCFIYKVSGRISVTQLAFSSKASYVSHVYQICIVAKLADENFFVPFRFFKPFIDTFGLRYCEEYYQFKASKSISKETPNLGLSV